VKSLLHRRPSPALVIACLALFVSLSGVSYGVATGFIDSREIKNNSVRTKDLRNNDIRTKDLRNNEVRGVDIRNSTIQSRDIGINQVTGTDVRESTLQKVPSAATADSATSAQSATSAGSLNGVRVLPVKHRSGDVTGRVFFNAGGLQLVVSCAAGDEDVTARTTVANGEVAVISNDADGMDQDAGGLFRGFDDDFDPADSFDIKETVTAADDRIYELHYIGGDGTNVTAHLITDDDQGGNNCVVGGYAVLVP
jgi:hypothetical protein